MLDRHSSLLERMLVLVVAAFHRHRNQPSSSIILIISRLRMSFALFDR